MKRISHFLFAVAILGLGLPAGGGAVGIARPGPCAQPDDLGLAVGAGEPGAPEETSDGPAAASPRRGRARAAAEATLGGISSTRLSTISGAPASGASRTPAQAVGPARHRFLPTSVGAGPPPTTAALGPPTATRGFLPGACGSAGSVCAGQVTANPRPPTVTTPVSRRRSRRGPRVVDPGPGTGCGGAGFDCNQANTARPKP